MENRNSEEQAYIEKLDRKLEETFSSMDEKMNMIVELLEKISKIQGK